MTFKCLSLILEKNMALIWRRHRRFTVSLAKVFQVIGGMKIRGLLEDRQRKKGAGFDSRG